MPKTKEVWDNTKACVRGEENKSMPLRASPGRRARWWSALGHKADFRHRSLDACDSVQETLCSIPSLHRADKIVLLNSRNTKFFCEDMPSCNGSPGLSSKPPRNTNRTQFSPQSQTPQNATRKSVTKVEIRKREKKGKERNGEKENGEYVGNCVKMKPDTKRVLIRRKVPAWKVLTILLIRTLAFFEEKIDLKM